MAYFNFDSESNIINTKIPAAKAINKLFCGVKADAGLWIANDNMQASKWKKNCESDCNDDCSEHYVGTKKHVVQAQTEEVVGMGIVNPRMCIIRRTKLLRLTTDKNVYFGYWIKGDGEIKNENGSRKFSCARRYLIVFLDENNEPLHDEPIQLTAKGTFQVSFDTNLVNFRNEIKTAYAKSMKKQIGQLNEAWYAMCVFAPKFDSRVVGKAPLVSNACCVKSYEVPTEANWLSFCVGRNQNVNEIIHLHYIQSEKWMQKFATKCCDDEYDSISSISA